ncbi:hypothetical protein Tco_0628597 [Tanacetum coccineum]|uniref:Reverse transcriptase Ty1/copia-type domain-containing protein n=1 Tax=Tanacetum coccineum TaxID=301880 RepID=A0ABQ4WQS6_9ASTR
MAYHDQQWYMDTGATSHISSHTDYHTRQTLLRCDSTGDLYPLHVEESLSSDVISTTVHSDTSISEHHIKWIKDHPLQNIIGDPSRPVSTRLQLHNKSYSALMMPSSLSFNLRRQMDELGGLLKNKARLVAREYRQEEGIDFKESFAPVARLEIKEPGTVIINDDLPSEYYKEFLYGMLQKQKQLKKHVDYEQLINVLAMDKSRLEDELKATKSKLKLYDSCKCLLANASCKCLLANASGKLQEANASCKCKKIAANASSNYKLQMLACKCKLQLQATNACLQPANACLQMQASIASYKCLLATCKCLLANASFNYKLQIARSKCKLQLHAANCKMQMQAASCN